MNQFDSITPLHSDFTTMFFPESKQTYILINTQYGLQNDNIIKLWTFPYVWSKVDKIM